MDATEPPRIVFASRESCPDAEASLDRAMAGARAARGWVVAVRVEKASRDALAAEGHIDDADGRSIAHRVLGGVDCEGLARAMGLWASLVLDAELARPRARPGDLPPPSPSNDVPPAHSTPAPAASESTPPSEMDLSAQWGGRARENADVAVERADELRWEEPRTIEIGLGTLLMGGTGADATLGLTPYAVVETTRGLLLRPALVVGASVMPLDRSDRANATWVGTRVDVCSRLPGSYARGRGIQLDVCGGAEGGLAHFAGAPAGYSGSGAPATGTTLPELTLGPSVDLRGELGKSYPSSSAGSRESMSCGVASRTPACRGSKCHGFRSGSKSHCRGGFDDDDLIRACPRPVRSLVPSAVPSWIA